VHVAILRSVFVAVIILKTPCKSLITKILFWRSVHRCYTDNNTVRLEAIGTW